MSSTMQQFYRCGRQNQQSTQHNNQVGMDIQQSSRGNNINIIIILIIHVVMALLHHPTVGLVSIVKKCNKNLLNRRFWCHFCIGKYNGGFHLSIFLRICCFIISFAYLCYISVLTEVNMDCIIHVNMSCPLGGHEAGKCIIETLCFCVVASVFSQLMLLLLMPNIFAIHSTISSSFYICFAFFVPTGQFSNEPTRSLCFLLKKGSWRHSLLGQTRIGTCANFWENL